MTERISTTVLTGWIQPDTWHSCGDDLHINVDGTFAGEAPRITICLVDARRHGFPAAPADPITRLLGNWLEISGTFQASPLDDPDRDPEYTGDLTVLAFEVSHRLDAAPDAPPGSRVARKTITAWFPAPTP